MNIPNYNYGQYYGYAPYNTYPLQGYDPAAEQKLRQDRKRLRFLSNMAGLAVILYVAVSVGIFLLEQLLPDFSKSFAYYGDIVDTVNYILFIFVPFFVVYKIIKARQPLAIPFKKPKNAYAFCALIFAAWGICVMAQYVTVIWVALAGGMGLELKQPEQTLSPGVAGIVIMYIQTALLPAFLEEFALRGVVLGSLRKYGDWFAIVSSSVIFGILHGNLIQAPFAIIVGMALGYLAVRTGSLWPCVIVHFLNNAMSVTMQVIQPHLSDVLTAVFIYGSYVIILAAALISVLLLAKNKPDGFKPAKAETEMTSQSKTLHFITTPGFIVSMVILIYLTSFFVVLK